MQPPGWPQNADDDGVMDQPVHGGNRDHRVAEIIAERREVNVGGQDLGRLHD